MLHRVLLVDDHDLIRQGLRRAFERSDDFDVVGETSSAAEAVRLATHLVPDVAVLDVRLPDGTGLDVARTLRAGSATLGLVVLTMYAGDDQLFAALDAGASAFVAKDAPVDAVLAAARHAVASPLTFSSSDLGAAMRRRLNPALPRLSPREREVLCALSEGLAVSGIAKQLRISESTAKSHISKLYEKLGASNRAQALMAGLRGGLIPAPGDARADRGER